MADEFRRLGMHTCPNDLQALRELASWCYMGKNAYRGAAEPLVVVEVGSYAGLTAAAMADACDARVYCVDTWAGSPGRDAVNDLYAEHGHDAVFKAFCANMGPRLFKTVFPLRGPSLLWASVLPVAPDLVFIDGCHNYEDVKADIEAWSRVVRPGGVVACHDFTNTQHPGVARAVCELVPADRRRQSGWSVVWWEKEVARG